MILTKLAKYGSCLLLPFLLLSCNAPPELERPPIPVHVDTLTLSPSLLRLTKELPGRISALKEAEVRPQVTGIVTARLFEEGSFVNRGDVLYTIDPMSYQATVNSARAQLEKAKANESTAKKLVERYQALLTNKLTSQELYDDAVSAYQQAKAEVAIYQAALDNANIELSYTEIKAPISGTIGLSEVSEGSLVSSGQASYMTTITQSDQVYIDMQQSSLSLYKLRQEYSEPDGNKDIQIPVDVALEDGTLYDKQGYLTFSDTHVSDSTGSVTLRALVPNDNKFLLPGMFVRATISMPNEKEYLVVPQSAVVRSQSGEPSVFIVNDDNVTEKKSVVLGAEVDTGWVVEQGLNFGDNVVITNLNQMKNDLNVIIDSKTDNNGDVAYSVQPTTHN
ncbi:efflux RND transporter periplasmic adaptor subunit [Reinekea thalattae]|uniref:Efflux RND transporter periplasmic adaptor subunit n=1 Tax=Reinekea thalattae TaxID=2593301 RepID=A0A5C8Z8S8_9GAMM|nr:efflux RND transporter periplasmic adaptor subunit [Reinekea thalattae]TXR53678.1 efflux RND transporter periplasmic adaptor subunit [Reinekea thalattae]